MQPPIAIGCMRLSTAADRDEARGIEVLHAALDAGVTLFDTANAYCLDATETGHNERLIARALAAWRGDRSGVRIATKGGLTRPEGRWEADGRARALTAACESSLIALGVERIDLYQLHAPDPRVPLATSVRALHALRRRGLIDGVGLCNVTVGQIEEAQRITGIDAVQVELSLWNDHNVLSGVVEFCTAHGIPLLAYRPLGGPGHRRRIATDPVLARLAADHACTPFEIALAALADISPVIVPLPGPTRVETARSAANAAKLRLTDDDRAQLRERFAVCRAGGARAARIAVGARRDDAEVVLIMGLPAAGKSTIAERLAANGYARVNRDEKGGSLDSLLPVLDTLLASGTNRVVLDNTYVTRQVARRGPRRSGTPCGASAMPVAVDERGGRAGQRRDAHRVEVRAAARPRRDARGVAHRCVRISAVGTVPLSTRARGATGVGRLLADRRGAVRPEWSGVGGSSGRRVGRQPARSPAAPRLRPRRQVAPSSCGATVSCREAARATGRR